jgi:hypothetical protein
MVGQHFLELARRDVLRRDRFGDLGQANTA